MDRLNGKLKAETITILKELFSDMCLSRRQLKPILSEIIRAIDNNLFVDANSDEVKELLEEILEMQDTLSKVDALESAVKTKKLAVIDEAIKDMDRQHLASELKTVLAKFKNLVCSSDDENQLDAAKRLKRQAFKLAAKAEKIDADVFNKEGIKFIDVAEKIEDPSKITSEAFLEIQENFPENKFLAYALLKNSLHFESEEEEIEIEEVEEVNKPVEVEKLTEEATERIKIFQRIEEISSKAELSNIPLDNSMVDEDSFKVESKKIKKNLSVKSLNSKLHEFVNGRESLSYPILRTFCKCRIFSSDPTFEDDPDDKVSQFLPVIMDKLYNWGIADKVEWQEINFYYLNDQGRDLLSRVLSVKNIKLTKNSSESNKKRIANYFRRYIIFATIWELRGKKNYNKADGEMSRAWIRSIIRLPNSVQMFFVFSLLFLDDNWIKNVDNFLNVYREDRKLHKQVNGLFLITDQEFENITAWIEFFKSLDVIDIYIFQLKKDACKLIDENGVEIPKDEWADLVSVENVDAEDDFSEVEDEEIDAEIESENYSEPEEEFDLKPINDSDQLKLFDQKFSDEYNEIENHSEDDNLNDDVDEENFDAEAEKSTLTEEDHFIEEVNQNSEIEIDEVENSNDDLIESEETANQDLNDEIDDDNNFQEINESTNDFQSVIDNKPKSSNKVISSSYSESIKQQFSDLSDEDRFIQEILFSDTKFFIRGNASRGMLFLHLLDLRQSSKNEDWASNLNLEVGYILDDPMNLPNLRGFDPFDFWDNYFTIPNVDSNDLYDHLNLAAIIKSFFAPPEPMSFQLKSRWNQLNEDRSNVALKNYPSTKKLINLFKNFAEQTHASFISCLNVDHSTIESDLKKAFELVQTIRSRADAVVRVQIKHPRSKGLVKQLYDHDGEVRTMLNVEDETFNMDTIINYCNNFADEDLRRFENQSAVINEEIFSEAKIGDYLDEIWSSIKVESKKNEKFISVERTRQMNLFKQSLVALLSYTLAKKRIDSIKSSGKHKAPSAKALEILNDIVTEFKSVNQEVSVNFLGAAVFIKFIENLAEQINGKDNSLFYRDCLLGSKYLELTAECLPITKSYGTESFSFANRVFEYDQALKNLDQKSAVNIAYETAVRNYDLGVLKLLEINFREMIDRSDEELDRRYENVRKQVDRQIDRIYHEFLDNLELDRNYDRITDQEEIDRYITIATEAKEHFTETKNAGIFQRFINACSADIAKASLPHKNALEQRLHMLEEKLENQLNPGESINEKYPIIAETYRQLNLGNLTVAEDYLNRWEENNSQFNALDVIDSQNDSFDNFLNGYEYIFNSCLKSKSESLEKIYTRMKGNSFKNRSEKDAADVVSAWQGLNTDLQSRAETSIKELLKHFSFDNIVIETVERIKPNQWNFHIAFPGYQTSKAAYPHPFAVYGTEVAKKGLSIIYLASNRTVDNIIQTVANYAIKQDCGIICLVDFALSLADRRRLAQAFKIRPELKNIIVIDRVMAIYLTRFEDSVRGVKMLKTALPFARVQPYTTGGVVAPEMFIGRSEELAKIRDMSGPVFVYGGRQLGKSALLRQVRNIENDPANENFAFFIELKNLDAEKSLEKIVRELKDAKLIAEDQEVNDWDNFSIVISDLMSGKAEENNLIAEGMTPKKLMLLLDESDEFLASVESSENRAIDVLRELHEKFSDSFKFVLAGLHKVIRFEKNSTFGNLDHISVLPFTPTDALELLLKPMSFMGFVIEDESLMSAIFSRANYYPGLIQYYCKMIVDAAGDNYSQRNFDVTKNPPYKLDDEYLKNMLGKRDFQDEINKKFQITLKLDDDNYYEIIALVIAMAYYENNRPVHIGIKNIKDTCYIYGVDKIAEMTNVELENLLGEMVELNLLRKVEDNYEFNRYAFWHMMGTETEVEERLESYGK